MRIIGVLSIIFLASISCSNQPPPDAPIQYHIEPICPVTSVYTPFLGSCPTNGVCDDPGIRDTTPTTHKTIRTTIHVIERDGDEWGDNVENWLGEMNLELREYGFELQSKILRHRDNGVCVPQNSNSGEWLSHVQRLKSQYSERPDLSLNIILSCAQAGGGGIKGETTFPWRAEALGRLGGIWLPSTAIRSRVLIHELGHTLGLYHTYRGTEEVAACGPCYDFVDARDGDWRGDFVSDTPAEIRTSHCGESSSQIDCAGSEFPAHLSGNPMGASFDSCESKLTVQQVKRAHCWFGTSLRSWLVETA